MKIVCLIDSLASGGAQRQMVNLAALLQSQPHHQVNLVVYHDFDHYLEFVQNANVEVQLIQSKTLLGRFWNIRKAIKKRKPDAIIGFLRMPNYVSIMAGIRPNRIPVLVSERNFDSDGVNWRNRLRFNFFRFATQVVTNSYSQKLFIEKNYAFLKSKLSVIPNCVDLDCFHPALSSSFSASSKLRIVGVGSLCHRKNVSHLIDAVHLLAQRSPELEITVDWYGSSFTKDGQPTADSEYYFRMAEKIKQIGLENRFQIHEPVKDIAAVYREFDACCLPSFREGYPNVVCEAMASGLPILASDVSDNRILLKGDGEKFMFDPHNVDEMAKKIQRLALTDAGERKKLGALNRQYAEQEFTSEAFLDRYEQILKSMVDG